MRGWAREHARGLCEDAGQHELGLRPPGGPEHLVLKQDSATGGGEDTSRKQWLWSRAEGGRARSPRPASWAGRGRAQPSSTASRRAGSQDAPGRPPAPSPVRLSLHCCLISDLQAPGQLAFPCSHLCEDPIVLGLPLKDPQRRTGGRSALRPHAGALAVHTSSPGVVEGASE